MTEFTEKYINLFIDYGFKRLFGVFDKLFETAEIVKFTPAQIQSYEDSLKYYRDLKNSLDTAKEEGVELGKFEVARKALKKGYSIEEIIELTDLTKEQIEQIKGNDW